MKILIRQQRSVPRIHALGDPTSKLLGATLAFFFERAAPYLILCISEVSYTFHRRMNSCQLGGVSNNVFILSEVFLCTQFSNWYLSSFLNLKTYSQYLTQGEVLHLLLPYPSKKSGMVDYSHQWPQSSYAWHGPPASHDRAKRGPCRAEKDVLKPWSWEDQLFSAPPVRAMGLESTHRNWEHYWGNSVPPHTAGTKDSRKSNTPSGSLLISPLYRVHFGLWKRKPTSWL